MRGGNININIKRSACKRCVTLRWNKSVYYVLTSLIRSPPGGNHSNNFKAEVSPQYKHAPPHAHNDAGSVSMVPTPRGTCGGHARFICFRTRPLLEYNRCIHNNVLLASKKTIQTLCGYQRALIPLVMATKAIALVASLEDTQGPNRALCKIWSNPTVLNGFGAQQPLIVFFFSF